MLGVVPTRQMADAPDRIARKVGVPDLGVPPVDLHQAQDREGFRARETRVGCGLARIDKAASRASDREPRRHGSRSSSTNGENNFARKRVTHGLLKLFLDGSSNQ